MTRRARPSDHIRDHLAEAARSLAAADQAAALAPLPALRHAVDARGELDALVGILAAQARIGGASWAAIGQQLGTSKQAAQQRYGPAAADQLLRETIRSDARQPALTPASDPDPSHLLTHDLIDGWTLWELDDDSDLDLGVDPDRDETDVTGAQQWAAGILTAHGVEVASWQTRPGRLNGEDPGWSPVIRRRPTRAPARPGCVTRCINGNGSASDHRGGGPASALVRVDGCRDRGMHCYCQGHDHEGCAPDCDAIGAD